MCVPGVSGSISKVDISARNIHHCPESCSYSMLLMQLSLHMVVITDSVARKVKNQSRTIASSSTLVISQPISSRFAYMTRDINIIEKRSVTADRRQQDWIKHPHPGCQLTLRLTLTVPRCLRFVYDNNCRTTSRRIFPYD